MQEGLETARFQYGETRLDVVIDFPKDTAWLSLDEMALLFQRDRSSLGKRLRKLRKEMENQKSVWAKIARTGSDGKTYLMDHYCLDAVISIGKRINPKAADALEEFVKDRLKKHKREGGDTIIIYNNGNISLPVTISPNEETVWLNKDQIVLLFDTVRQNVEYHIANIYEQKELEPEATCKEILQVQSEGGRNKNRLIKMYNLDMIISLGFRINNKNGYLFRKWATKILKEYLLKGYVINEDRSLVTNENYVNLIHRVENIDRRLSNIEGQQHVEKEKIFFDGAFFDARAFLKTIFARARKEIILIDPYADFLALDYLKEKKASVTIALIVSSKSRISKRDVESFNKQYGGLSSFVDDSFHDRFIILDKEETYHLGASLNTLGKKTFGITKVEDVRYLVSLLNKLTGRKD